MSENLTPSQENYLEHIHRLSKEGPVRVREIAAAAGVRLPSVTRAVGKLAAACLVSHQAYGTVEITATGIRAAEEVVRRDSCLQRLLVDVLAMNEDTAKDEVCRLEHVVSLDVLSRLEILVRHATLDSSASWLNGLRRKVRKLDPSSSSRGDAQVGNASLHAVNTRNSPPDVSRVGTSKTSKKVSSKTLKTTDKTRPKKGR
ncbi:MAG: metal-dependent transcriptional regulator [Planctomycetota bacterium]